MLPDALKDHAVAAALDAALPDAITGGHAERNEPTLWIEPARIVEVCRYLKDQQQFVRLSAITAVDWLPADPRFEVVYLLHSLEPQPTAAAEVLGCGSRVRDRFRHRRLAHRGLVRTRSVRYVRRSLPQSSRPDPDPDAERLGRSPAAQGLSGARIQVQLSG